VPLLLLDEPTSGLDPLMEQVFAKQVREWASGGGTVLLSSHILSEVEALCDRVTIIRSGRAVETGSLADLRHLRRTRVRAELLGSMDGIASVPGLHDVAVADGVLTCTADPEAINDLLGKLAGIGVHGLTCSPPSLEELFLDVYRTPS
jgi:ABC-2 type transport system ATP-binding protein